MKKALSAVLAVVLVLGVCFSVPMIASAENADKFTYELDNAENPTGYIITGVKDGVTGPVEIPATYKPEGDINLFYPKAQEAVNLGDVTGVTVVINGEGDEDDHGTVTVTEATDNTVPEAPVTTVTLTMAPEAGYELGDVTITSEQDTDVTLGGTGNTLTFVKKAEATYTVAVPFTAIKYTVTVTNPEVGGTIEADKTEGVKGATVTLTANPATEYTFKRWIVTGEGASVEGNVLTIGTANVTVTAEFTKNTYAISHDATIAAYVNNEVVTVAAKDAEVVIKPVDATKILKNVTVKDADEAAVTVEDNKFTMPGKAVTVTVAEGDLVQGYAVNVAATENGTVTVNKTLAAKDDVITVTTTPATGYKLGTLKVMNGQTEVAAEADGSYKMPEAAITVTATFVKEEYTITLPTNVINGTIAVKDATETTKFYYGDEIDLTLTPAAGCQLGTLTYTYVGLETPVAIENGSFTMPAKNITINVTFVPKEMDVIGIKAGAFQNAKAANITAFTVAEGQDLFVAKDGVLFEKVTTTAGDPAVTTTSLKLIAFPANYTVAENAAKTYTIPASVTVGEGASAQTYAVTAVADGAFQALGNVQYVFCANAQITTKDKHPAFADNNKLHLGMTAHTKNAGTTVAATCKVAGSTTFKCTVCSVDMPEETIVLPIVADAHTYGDWVTTTPATCILEGVAKRTCINTDGTNVCGHVETKLLPATNEHVAGAGTVTKEATCEEDGVMTFYCTGCNTEVVKTEVIEKLGHKISDPDVVVKATCTEDGYVKGVCDNCGDVVTLTEEATNHKMITVVDAEATCTVPGSKHQECEVCGYMDEDAVIETIPALGHSKAEDVAWTIVKEATCAEAGLLQKFCDTCRAPLTDADGEEITRVLEATGEHEYKDYKETKAPTCTEKGTETGTCACGATDVREVKALGHKFAEEFTTDKEATCTEAGSKSKHCTAEGCKEKSEVTAIPVKPHTADDTWTTVEGKAATCYAEGEKTGTCAVCKTQNCVLPIEKLAHTWAGTAVPVVGTITKEVEKLDKDGKPVLDEDGEPVMETITYKAATCEAEGYTVKYCTVENCGAYDEASLTKVAKLEHNWAAYPQGVTATAKVDPTCTTDGKEYKYCDRDCCKREVEIKIPTTGHSWASSATVLTQSITVTDEDGNETTYNAPSCKGEGTDGYKAVFCTVAGCNGCKDFEVVKAPAHVPEFTQWTAGTAATCLNKATETNVCVNCDDILTREVGELADHDFSETKTTVYPTCEEAGVEYYACEQAGCKAKGQEKVLPALGHIHADDAEFEGTEATCTTDGVKVKVCTRMFYYDAETGKTLAEFTFPTDDGEAGDDNAASGGTEQGGTTPTPTAEGDETTGTEDDETEVVLPAGVKYCDGAKQVTPKTGHAFSSEYTVDTQPTCTQDGVKSRHCTNTGCAEKTNILPVKALGHEYGETYTVDTKATCSSVGYESIHCTRYADCKTKKTGSTREIPTTDHTYPDTTWKTVTAPTCEEKGVQENFCSVCNTENKRVDAEGKPISGYTTRETNARGHSWAMDYVTVKATCTTDGKTYLPCERANCDGESDVTVLPKTGHTWATESDTDIPVRVPAEGDEPVVEVTCTTDGYEYKYCKTCKVWIGEVVKAEGHKYSTTPTRVEPTCHSTGSLTGECTVCKAKDAVQVLPKLDHTWGDWELVEDATDCTAANSMIRACTVEACDATELGKNDKHTVSSWIIGTKATCGDAGEMHTECKVCAKVIETEAIAATGKHDLKETITKAPTCNEKGTKTVECQAKDCDYTATVEIPANGHSYTEWKVFVEPTCTTKGIRQSVCEVCLTTQSEKILALGHDLGDYITDTPAACGKVGSKHKECSRCDYKTDAETIAALDHNFVGNDCANKCGAKIYEYALIEGSTTDIIITKYNGSDENLVIPAEIDGYVVKAIGNRAFMKTEIKTTTSEVVGEDGETTTKTTTTINYVESDFTSLTIPATITTIGDYAFANSKLTLVNIPATVTTIGECAFGFDVEITMVPEVDEDEDETQTPAEGETPAEDEEVKLVEDIDATKVANFTIYGVKGSAAETYAKQDAENADDDFTFVEVKDVYEVVIDEEATNIEEVAGGVLFKEFVTEDIDEDTPAPSIEDQLKAIVVLEENSTYTLAVEPSQSYSYKVKDEAGNEKTETVKSYGTGTKVLVKDATGNVVDEIVIIVEGDVNGDGAVDALDCMLIQLAAAANTNRPLEGIYYTAGNITADTALDANDLSAAVLKIFGEDLVVEEEEETTVTTTAPSTTEPTTQAPASTEPSTEGTSDESTPAESTPVESTPAATESQPAATTTTTQAPATTVAPTTTNTQTPVEG